MTPEEIRRELELQVGLSPDLQDTELMRECAARLFVLGQLQDVQLIWRARKSSFDAACSIEPEFLCGPGLAQARASLAHLPEALQCLHKLNGFAPDLFLQELERYYGPELKSLEPPVGE
ncbi:hypothetical protein JST97_03590 [bacterium]|nr:hypothetical protein [bacterium]